MTAIARYRATTTEAQMRDAIEQAVALKGGKLFFIRDSRATPEMAHWPDLVLMLPNCGVVAFVELKSQKRIVTAGQHGVMATLEQCRDAVSMIVRPEPKPGEVAYAAFMDWLEGVAS
jgi:hypothetical protein